VLPFSVLVEEAVAPYRNGRRPVEIDILPETAEPMVSRSPEIVHALGNLVDNALRVCQTDVEIVLDWTPDRLFATVSDDGPSSTPMCWR
jgi:two-component system sensor histidine kinase RegB